MKKLIPLNDRIVVKPIEQTEQMYGNIIIADMGKERPEMGDDIDHESKARHIGHAVCNLMMMEQLLNLIEQNPELAHLDDRPTKWFEGQKY